MIRLLEPEDIARELDDRVLKAASGANQRHATFPGESNCRQRAIHTPIGTSWRDEKASVTHQTLLRSLRHDLDSGYPFGADPGMSERLIRGLMGWSLSAEVSDNPNQRFFDVAGFITTVLGNAV